MHNIFEALGREVELVPIGELRPWPGNARRHTKKQVRKLADTILATGWAAPVVADELNTILAGHGRFEAAKLLNLSEVPVVRLLGRSEEQKAAYVLADNRLHDESSFDLKALKLAVVDLSLKGFEMEKAGFDTLEVDRIISLDDADPGEDEEVVNVPGDSVFVVSRPGDIWHLPNLRLIHGDARDPATYERLLEGERVQLAFLDPPYGCRIENNVSGLGKVRHENFLMGAGETSLAEFGATLLRPAFKLIAAHAMPGALAFICTDWRASPFLHDAAQGVFHEQKNLIVWAKTNAGMGTSYRSAHELIYLYKISPGKHINNFGLGEGGRHRCNVWTYPGANTFRKGRMEDLAAHSTVKPRKLVADAIIDCSRRGGLVLDAFAGSGTTLAAAHVTGRRGYGIELDGKYVDVALRRLAELTGETPLLGGEVPFEEVAAMRRAERDGGGE